METESPLPEARPFRIFSGRRKSPPATPTLTPPRPPPPTLTKETSANVDPTSVDTDPTGFADLGLAEWAVETCQKLGMHRPTAVQSRCIPRVLAGDDVLGLAQTGSGKTAAFALPILHRLAEGPYGVFALVLAPTRELACQLVEQFRALGSSLNVRCTLVVGGMDMTGQAKALARRPHVVVATPGRIKVLMDEDPGIPAVFSKTKFLVLDEADRVLDVGFEEELRVIFKCLPKDRQTLLFSATMTNDLQALLEISGNKSYFFEEYEGFKTVDSLKQQLIYIPKAAKTCHFLSLLLEELDHAAVALHSHNSQSMRLSALNRFKSGQVPILIATDVASRGLDIPTVDLVINYDIPRYSRDYVHRVGRTARAGRGGLSVSFVTQNDVDLIHEIEAVIGKKMDKIEYKENEVLENITKVCKAKRVATMNMIDDGFEEKANARKEQKLKQLEEKGLLKKKRRKQ